VLDLPLELALVPLRAPSLRDVPEGPDAPGHLPSVDQRGREPLEHAAVLEPERVERVLRGGVELRDLRLEHLGVLELLQDEGDELRVVAHGEEVLRDAPHLGEPLVGRDDVAGLVHDQEPVGGGVQDGAEQPFPPGGLLVEPAPVGHVVLSSITPRKPPQRG
jgi:hypothetical protein